MWKSFVSSPGNMVHTRNPRSLSPGGSTMMVIILQRNGMRTCANIARHSTITTWKGSSSKVQQRSTKHINGIPRGPPPAGTSSMRVLPDVHEALRQNDPRMATHSQPVLKKAPPSAGRPMPSVFYSDKEPPRIGTPVQPLHHLQQCVQLKLKV